MAISDKLNYLIETKQLFKDRLNSLGAEIIENTTFRNYLNWLDNMYNKVSDKTDLAKNGIVGRTSQDGEPTPESPVEIKNLSGDISYKVSGKNLFDKNNANILIGSINNNKQIEDAPLNRTLWIKCNPNTTYTVQKRNDGNVNRFAVGSSTSQPITGSYISNFIRDNDAQSITYTTSANDNHLIVQFYRMQETVLTIEQVLDSIQIEERNTATDFEPYISRTFPLSLKSKNLFDFNTITNVTNGNNDDGLITSININANTATNVIPYFNSMKLVADTYTYSFEARLKSGSSTIAKFNDGISDGTNVVKPTLSNEFQTYSFTKNYSSDTNIVRLLVQFTNSSNAIIEIRNIQIEEGSTSTSYEPYYNIELCEIDNYKDKIYSQDGKFYLHKEIEKISGTVNWVVNSIASNNRAVIPLAKIGYPLAIRGYPVEQCLSNYFQKTSQQEQSSSTEINTISANNDNIYIKFDSSINTTSLAKTKLDSMTDLIIYYPPVTPTTTEITEENYPTLYGQLKDIQDYLVQYKINNEFLLDYSSPEIEY